MAGPPCLLITISKLSWPRFGSNPLMVYERLMAALGPVNVTLVLFLRLVVVTLLHNLLADRQGRRPATRHEALSCVDKG
ncbi:MAG: hypothetical protein ACJASB_000356 [Shewanella psychromarinicola]